jgi:hypothetical protein
MQFFISFTFPPGGFVVCTQTNKHTHTQIYTGVFLVIYVKNMIDFVSACRIESIIAYLVCGGVGGCVT